MNKLIVAIIQARMGSSRLPNKVMKLIKGRPMLSYMIERLGFSKKINKIVIATSTSEKDDPIVDFCINENVLHYRGSEDDVLDRFYKTAKEFKAEIILRFTADCPLVDPVIIDELISLFINEGNMDHMNTGHSFPEGADAEILSFSTLEKAWKDATLKTEREHVTTHIWSNPEKFNTKPFQYSRNLSKYRYTVDEEQDFKVVESIFNSLYKKNEIFFLEDIIEYLDSNPDVFKLNEGIIRNEGLFKSIEEEGATKILEEYKKMRDD